MRKLIPLDVIDETIDEIRVSKSEVLKNLGNDSSDRSLTLQDLADAVDRALVEVSQKVNDALGDVELDEQAQQVRWWDPPEDGPYDFFWQGGLMEEGPLPRRDSSASRWNE